MKYPLRLHVCFLILTLIPPGLFIDSQLVAQSTASSIPNQNNLSSENTRAMPAVIFTIENTLTSPSVYFEYLEMNLPPPLSLEQVSPGLFHIYNLSPNRTYTLNFKGNGPALLGVTTLDISLIIRHILGTRALDPLRLIAADTTGDGRISAADLVDIRKVLLGNSPIFGAGLSWKFIPSTAEFLYVGTTIDLGTIQAIKLGHVN